MAQRKLAQRKLGRNPLEHLQKFVDEPLAPATHFALHGHEAHASRKDRLQTYVEKVKEMQIEVDWSEVFRSTLGLQVKKLSKFFSIS